MLALALCATLLLVTGCAKKPVAKVQPPPPPAPQPTVTLSVYPSDITQGQSAKLTWEAQNATNVSIEPIGGVAANGSQSVNPNESTTYRIVATGPGGSADSSARLTVGAPPPVASTAPSPTLQELFERNMKDAFFAYDSYNLDTETTQMLASNAQFLRQHPDLKFTVVGHCDERGSEEYNLALGASRAEAVKQALVAQGINGTSVATNSVGKEKPFCTESNEECWHLNRRGHFTLP
jgi:peptidoglycan-associated lipoprotein